MKAFEWLDLLDYSASLSESEIQIQERVRRFVSDRFMPRVAHSFEEAQFPWELLPEISSMGLLGCGLDGYDCLELSPREYGLAMLELERGDSGLRSLVSVQTSLAMFAIHRFGSDEQKSHYLPLMQKGECLGAFALTEPDFGSNPSGMRTRAVRKGKTWVLNGTKRWLTNVPRHQVAVVWAQTDNGIRGFLVPKETVGCTSREIVNKLSLRCSSTGEIILEECTLPEEAMLPGSEGLRSALECLSAARFGILWGVLGAAMACFQEARDFALERDAFGIPLAQKQLVQQKLVTIASEITQGLGPAWRLAELKQRGDLKPHQISLGKMNNVAMALRTARVARDILGASGVSLEYSSMRHSANLESVNTYEGTFDIHQLIVGEKLTGLSAF